MQKSFFKLITCLLIVALALSLVMASGCKNNQSDDSASDGKSNTNTGNTEENNTAAPTIECTIGVIADANILPATAIESPTGDRYKSLLTNQCYHAVLEYSEAIFLSAVDEYIESGIKNILLLGDLTQGRNLDAVTTVKAGLDKCKAAGVNVFTTLGLCDVFGKAPYYGATKNKYITERWNSTNFKDEFFGYMNATPYSEDANSYSYAVNIPNTNLALISFDGTTSLTPSFDGSCNHIDQNSKNYRWEQKISDEQIAWLESALQTAYYSGKTPIVATYFPFDNNFCDYMGTSTNETIIICHRYKEIRKLCTKYGVAAVFNSQVHMMGENVYTDDTGSFQEFSTGSLTTYPLPITTYDFMSDATFVRKISHMQKLNGDYLPDYTTASDRQTLTANAVSFAKQRVTDSFLLSLYYVLYGNADLEQPAAVEDILDTLTLYDAHNAACTNMIDTINEWAVKCNDLPLYGSGESVESICAGYGLTLPQSQYTTVRGFICEMVCRLYDGSFDMSGGSTNQTIFRYCFYSGLYLLANDYDIFGLFKAIEDSVIPCDLRPVIDKLFTENILDITINDLICSLMSIIAVPVNNTLGTKAIKVTDTASYLEVLDSLLLIALPLLETDDYDAAEGTVWGIYYKEIAELDKGLMYGDKFFDGIGAQFISRNAVSRR